MHIPVLDAAQAVMLDPVERSGGFAVCVGGDFARYTGPSLIGLPSTDR